MHQPYYNGRMADRLFTLDEARELLPTVKQILTEIQAAKGEVDSKGAEMARMLAITGGNGNLEGDLIRQFVNSLGPHLDIKGDVRLALVDRAGMNDKNGDVGGRAEHRALAVVEVDVRVCLAIGVGDVDGTPVVRADLA